MKFASLSYYQMRRWVLRGLAIAVVLGIAYVVYLWTCIWTEGLTAPSSVNGSSKSYQVPVDEKGSYVTITVDNIRGPGPCTVPIDSSGKYYMDLSGNVVDAKGAPIK